MKKVLKPKQEEEAIFYSDFSGRLFEDFIPVTITIECNYGSNYDGAKVEFHLSDKGLVKVLEFIKQNLCQETKKDFERCLSTNTHPDNNEIYQQLL